MKGKIELLKNESEPTESGIELSNYLESQKEIEVLNNEMPKIEKKQSELENVISVAKEKLENNSRLKNSNIISIDTFINQKIMLIFLLFLVAGPRPSKKENFN